MNLHLIQKLANKYKCKVGYSGHESGVSPSVVAVALGATSLERHITLDRSMYGSDQSASLELAGMRELVSVINRMQTAVGINKLGHITDEEKIIAKKVKKK